MKSELPPHIVDQAVDWAVKLGSGQAEPGVQDACDAWRREDPCHETAWQALGSIDQEFKKIPQSMAELACQTLVQAPDQMRKLKARRGVVKALFFAVLVMGLGYALGFQTFLRSKPVIYQVHTTLKGQRQTIFLPDNSCIILNTASRVQINYSSQKREIHLGSGEIFIETGRDQKGIGPKRPFWISSGNIWFEAVGTRFNLRMSEKSTQLYVSQGQVNIYLNNSPKPAVQVQAGQTFEVGEKSGAMPVELRHPVLVPGAWVKGMVMARKMPLNAFAGELSRYIPGRIDTDASAADLTISGVFQIKTSKDTAKILAALSQTLPVEIKKEGKERYTIYLLKFPVN